MDFDFAVAPPPANSATASARPPATARVPPATAEHEMVFWQSIADSKNPVEFEAYLSQFPDGVFRALAEARLAALRGRPDGTPPVAQPQSERTEPSEAEPRCLGDGRWCLMALADPPTCKFWRGELFLLLLGPTWSGEYSEGLADGPGTLRWKYDDTDVEASGLIQKGKLAGRWLTHSNTGFIQEIQHVDGIPHGPAIEGSPDWRLEEGEYVKAEKQGFWTIEFPDTNRISRGRYVDRKEHRTWIVRYTDGSREPYTLEFEMGDIVESAR